MAKFGSAGTFGREPDVKISRTRFKYPIFSHKTTFNNGELIPLKAIEILPGDTFKIDFHFLLRTLTPIKPVMDNLFLDVFTFFVPRRLTWTHWREFMGENRSDPWTSSVEYPLPHTTAPQTVSATKKKNGGAGYWFKALEVSASTSPQFVYSRLAGTLYKVAKTDDHDDPTLTQCDTDESYSGSYNYYLIFKGWDVGSLASYFGFPIGTAGSMDSGYFRGYALIWNEFFRDENYMNFQDTEFSNDSDTSGATRASSPTYPLPSVSQAVKGARPLNVARFHDAFSSVLPQPQFGDPVKIPFDGSLADVVTGDLITSYSSTSPSFRLFSLSSRELIETYGHLGTQGNGVVALDNVALAAGSSQVLPANLHANVGAIAGTILDLRNAYQIQKYLERSGRYGTRYIEMILGQFGVINPDYRLNRPDPLYRNRYVLNCQQVIQTSSTDSVTPQGNESAYSLTSYKDQHMGTFSFTEHGILYILACTRTSRSYSQGISREFSRRRKLDFYFPVFDHISEVPVLNKEVYNHYVDSAVSSGTYTYPEEVFGYQEPWYEYKNFRSFVTGEFDPASPNPLDFWHYGDFYLSEVYMSDEWLFETPRNVDRTLAVSSDVSNQFLIDVAFNISATRPMNLYSIPGLSDHF